METKKHEKKLIIIGSGPAGYTAAIYAARAELEPLLFEGEIGSTMPGGQLMTTTEVENYPGFAHGITGPELMEQCRAQAEKFGTTLLQEEILSIDLKARPFTLHTKSGERYTTEAVIIATGATAKRLKIKGTSEGEFWQRGVTACAVCDGAAPIFRNKELFVIGGGDSAVEEAVFLTKFGSKVYIVHRRDELRASKIMADRAENHPKIEILWNQEIISVDGSTFVERVTLKNTVTGEEQIRPAAGVFFAIGHTPNTAFLNGQLELDSAGYLICEPGTSRLSIPGVFAAGDVQDRIYRQAITAAGSGCMAALDAERFLSEASHGDVYV